MTEGTSNPYRSGYVAVIGRPNVGKSTLTNALLKFPLSIITAKPQTTRHRLLGIYTDDAAQIIFLDTPGLIEPRYRLHEAMMKAANAAISDADVLLLLVEASNEPFEDDKKVLTEITRFAKPVILVINKIDRMDKDLLLPLIDAYTQLHSFAAIVPISALQQTNIDALKAALLSSLPVGFPFYPPDAVTEHPERFFVCELIREQVFELYSEEIPFSTAVVIDEFRERSGHKDFIRARIIVERDSQKVILIGKKGQAIRRLGQQARRKVEEFLERPVYLELFVAVRANWRKTDSFLKEFGYDFGS